MLYFKTESFSKECKTTKVEPGQAFSVAEIVRRTLRGEPVNLNQNYYYEESIQPTDRLDIDIVDVQRVSDVIERERENAKLERDKREREQKPKETPEGKEPEKPKDEEPKEEK